jgi:RNA polymerase sigma-70 factor, ECF subfamily
MSAPAAGKGPGEDGGEDGGETMRLLSLWHAGDVAARDQLIERELPWIRQHVRQRLGPMLRARAETQDYVQEALLRVLDYGPRFVTNDRSRFRAMIVRVIENHLRDLVDWHAAGKRAVARERPLPSDSVIDLDSGKAITRPSEHAASNEQRAWLHLAMELLDPDDRRIILLRQWQELEFGEIAEMLGIAEDAARMRFRRALPRLGSKMEQLVGGGLP